MENLTTYENFKNTKDNILVIVDVQKSFEKYFPQNYVSELKEYSRKFDKVYQIFDTNKTNKPDYKFPNQVSAVDKRFGHKWFDENTKKNMETFNLNHPFVGQLFNIENRNEYLVYTNNNHKWFYVNERLAKLFRKLEGKNITLVGGAGSLKSTDKKVPNRNQMYQDSECLLDVELALKAFGVKINLEPKFIYSVQTDNSQEISSEIQK